MNSLRISGGRRLLGRVKAPGAKNSCLKLLALSAMASDTYALTNVPEITDGPHHASFWSRWAPAGEAGVIEVDLRDRAPSRQRRAWCAG